MNDSWASSSPSENVLSTARCSSLFSYLAASIRVRPMAQGAAPRGGQGLLPRGQVQHQQLVCSPCAGSCLCGRRWCPLQAAGKRKSSNRLPAGFTETVSKNRPHKAQPVAGSKYSLSVEIRVDFYELTSAAELSAGVVVGNGSRNPRIPLLGELPGPNLHRPFSMLGLFLCQFQREQHSPFPRWRNGYSRSCLQGSYEERRQLHW